MRFRNFFVPVILFLILAAGCSILPTKPGEIADSEVKHAEETKIFETAVAKAITEAAPPTATVTETAQPPATITVAPRTPFAEMLEVVASFSPTPDVSSTPKILPTSDDPWLLTNWCLEHVGCEKMEVKNQTNFWIAFFLKYTDTNVSKLFSIPPKGHAWITLRPGQYYYQVTSCGGAVVDQGNHFLSGAWYWIAKENTCK